METPIRSESALESYLDPMLWRQLKDVLLFLQANKYPHVPNPPSCKKRASVALIIRFRPPLAVPAAFNPLQCGRSIPSIRTRLDQFFGQQWVQQGEPEVLFIKRASRPGDRWTSHVAFPGGGREPGDEDDCAASVRETREEIGLDLNADHCVMVGNLPEQVVTTWWSKQPLMVLCPFVHLVLRPDIPPLTLQPAEVGSAHWVSIRALMSPHLRMFERSDVSDRFFRRGNYMTRRILRAMVGQLLFTARKLVPTESTYSRSISDYVPPNAQALSQNPGPIRKLHRLWQGPKALTSYKEPPLVLWGLTYGILANFLGLLPTNDRTKMWDWPTLSPWDIRLVIWLVTYKFRASKIKALGNPISTTRDLDEPQNGASLDGLDSSTFISSSSTTAQDQKPSSLDTVSEMLDGYFERLRNAIWVALALRLSASSLTALLLFRHYRSRRHMAHL